MIDFAKADDIDILKKNWKIIFGDTDGYIDLFFEYKVLLENTLVYRCHSGVIAGQIFWAEYDYKSEGRIYKAAYICGIGVLRKYRNMGIMSELMEYAHGVLSDRGYDCAVLIPASDELFKLYERFSYQTTFFVSKDVVPECEFELEAKPIKTTDYRLLYNEFANKTDYIILQSEYDLEVIFKELNLYINKSVIFYRNKKQIGYCLATCHDNKTYIRELVCEDKYKSSIAFYYNTDKVIAPGNDVPFGMMKVFNNDILPPDCGYMNMMLN